MLRAHVGHNHGEDFLVLAQEPGLDTRPASSDFFNRRGDVFSGADIPERQGGAEAVTVDCRRRAHVEDGYWGAEAVTLTLRATVVGDGYGRIETNPLGYANPEDE